MRIGVKLVPGVIPLKLGHIALRSKKADFCFPESPRTETEIINNRISWARSLTISSRLVLKRLQFTTQRNDQILTEKIKHAESQSACHRCVGFGQMD